MLHHGDYPPALKERIRGGSGHLSNKQALELFLNHKSPDLTHLFLSHLSEHNNTPELVHDLFSGIAGSTEIIIASR
jgi:phosphoribosyl 1,2-cyclic phosphodiesterase